MLAEESLKNKAPLRASETGVQMGQPWPVPWIWGTGHALAEYTERGHGHEPYTTGTLAMPGKL